MHGTHGRNVSRVGGKNARVAYSSLRQAAASMQCAYIASG